jgi:hypothetical protein
MKTNETQNFVNGLNKLTYISRDGQTFLTLEGFEISYEFKIMETLHGDYPLQILFYIKKDGLYISSWGCYSNECNKVACQWILKTKSKIQDEIYYTEDSKKAEAKKLFNQLTK